MSACDTPSYSEERVARDKSVDRRDDESVDAEGSVERFQNLTKDISESLGWLDQAWPNSLSMRLFLASLILYR
jgi:hypothetical protein